MWFEGVFSSSFPLSPGLAPFCCTLFPRLFLQNKIGSNVLELKKKKSCFLIHELLTRHKRTKNSVCEPRYAQEVEILKIWIAKQYIQCNYMLVLQKHHVSPRPVLGLQRIFFIIIFFLVLIFCGVLKPFRLFLPACNSRGLNLRPPY